MFSVMLNMLSQFSVWYNFYGECVFSIDCNGLFGMNLVKPCQTELVLTGNEFDAMAVYQEIGCCTVALPKGRTLLHQEVCLDILYYFLYHRMP